MGYIALATARYDEMFAFYSNRLGLPVIEDWQRGRGRGCRLDLGGGRLELLDANGAMQPLALADRADGRVHVVIEVPDVDQARQRLGPDVPVPKTHSWGAKTVALQDPDGNGVWILEWTGGSAPG